MAQIEQTIAKKPEPPQETSLPRWTYFEAKPDDGGDQKGSIPLSSSKFPSNIMNIDNIQLFIDHLQ